MLKDVSSFLKSVFKFLLFIVINIYISIFIFVKINPNYMKDEVRISFFVTAIILLILEYFILYLYRKNKTDHFDISKTGKQKRPVAIILLIVIFLWGFMKTAWDLFGYSTIAYYIVFNKIGIGYLFFIFSILILIFNGFTIWFLCKPKPIGFWIAISSLFLLFLESIVYLFVAMSHVDVAKNVYVISRRVSGLNANEEVVSNTFSISNMYAIFGLTVGLILLWASLLVWKRAYFFRKKGSE